MRRFKHFTWDDRLRLETMLRDGISKKDIAARFEFDLSSIYREIDRGKYQHKKNRLDL
jgi:IS30 family transposase